MLNFIPGGVRTLAFLFTFGGSLAAGKIIVPLLRRLGIGQTVRDDGPATHLVKNGTPTMGGLIFIIPAAIVLLVLSIFDKSIIMPLIAVAGFGLVGFADDWLKVKRKNKDGLTPLQKTVGLVFFAAIFSIYAAFSESVGTSVIIPLTGQASELAIPFWIFIPLSALVMYGSANAVNLTDGVDGLASSVTLLVMASFTLCASVGGGADGAATLTAAFAGGCLGFLFYNAHPARVIMGDCGSLALGGAVSAAAIVMRVPWILLLFGVIYVAETLSVMIQVSYFKRTRKRVFKMAPIHHHFELSGWSENRIVLVFSIITFVFCGAGIMVLFGRIF